MASGETILARLDAVDGLESVYVGPRLVSRSRVGAKPEGHAVPARGGAEHEGYRQAASSLVVVYDPVRGEFDLTADGQRVPPTVRPAALAPLPFAPSVPPFAAGPASRVKRWLWGAFAALWLVAGGATAIWSIRTKEPPAGEIRASTALLILHYPAGFKPLPEQTSGPGTKNKPGPNERIGMAPPSSFVAAGSVKGDKVVFALSVATRGANVGRDPWVVSNYVHDGFAKGIEKKLFTQETSMTETARENVTCVGHEGAAVTATFRYGSEGGTFWTCSFLDDGNAFMVGYVVGEKLAADEPALREIVERIELLHR